jgi:hypothetical protein
MPRVRCNLLMPKPLAPALLAGMARALSVHRGRGVPHAASETHRWRETRTRGRRHTVIAVLQGSEVVHLTRVGVEAKPHRDIRELARQRVV